MYIEYLFETWTQKAHEKLSDIQHENARTKANNNIKNTNEVNSTKYSRAIVGAFSLNKVFQTKAHREWSGKLIKWKIKIN